MIVSLILAIWQPITVLLLTRIVLHFRQAPFMTLTVRLWVAFIALGLVLHSGQQWALVFDYRPPRTWLWVPIFLGLNGLVWTVYLQQRRRMTGMLKG